MFSSNLSSFETFLDHMFPNWRQLPIQALNKQLEEVIGALHLRIRHRRCTVFGIPQVTFSSKREFWLSEGHLTNISSHISREWAVQAKNPDGPFVYMKNDPGSLYPIDLVHNLEWETEEETANRLSIEKIERRNALVFTANRIAVLGKNRESFEKQVEKQIEKLARRLIQITLNS